jgi:hypothetical protein
MVSVRQSVIAARRGDGLIGFIWIFDRDRNRQGGGRRPALLSVIIDLPASRWRGRYGHGGAPRGPVKALGTMKRAATSASS